MNKVVRRVTLIVCILSLLGHFLVYPHLPETIPIHWGSNGEVNGYGPKIMDLVLAALPLITFLLLRILPKIDPKRENYKKHAGVFDLTLLGTTFLLLAVSWAAVGITFGMQINISMISGILVGVLLIVLGNYMPRIRHNYTFGIRTPWTIANEEVWTKTHRVGGLLFVPAGVLMILTGFFPNPVLFGVAIGYILLTVVFDMVYSYLLFRKSEQNSAK